MTTGWATGPRTKLSSLVGGTVSTKPGAAGRLRFPRRGPRGWAAVLFPLLGTVVAVSLFASGGVARAQTTQVLVSNLGQTMQTATGLENGTAQGFRTGPNATGYALTSIELLLGLPEGAFPTVTLRSGSAAGSMVADLVTSDSRTNNLTVYTFTPNTSVTLNPNTDYWVVVSGTVFGQVWGVAWIGDDAPPAPGWSIPYRGQSQRGPGLGFNNFLADLAGQIRVNGEINNVAATGAPNIAGTARVGEALTVDTSRIADDNGLRGVSFIYVWTYEGETTVQLLTSSHVYAVKPSDAGRKLKVTARFTDDAGHAETRESSATATVTAIAPGPPENLTASSGTTGSLTLNWQAPTFDERAWLLGNAFNGFGDGGASITGYTVQWKSSTDSWTDTSAVSEETLTGTTHTITGLTGGAFTARVIASNAIGDGTPSRIVTLDGSDVTVGPGVFGQVVRGYAENGSSAVGTYSPVPSGTFWAPADYDWSLSGTDQNDFTIGDSGELRFRNSPDFESPADAGRDNRYEVTVSISDGDNQGALEVTVLVADVNEPPRAVDDSARTRENTATNINVLTNDRDPEGQDLNVDSLGTPDHGLLTLHANDIVRYHPPEGFRGVDTFTYEVSDGVSTSEATVAITVRNPDPPPPPPPPPPEEAGRGGGGGGGGSSGSSEPPAPPAPATSEVVIGSTPAATATELPGNRLLIQRHDAPDADFELAIGAISADCAHVALAGVIRDESLGQTYVIVRRDADGRIVRRWVSPDSPLVYQIPWSVVNTQYTVPIGVVAVIPLDDQCPQRNLLARRFDGGDDRIFAFDSTLGQWRHVPDIPTFQALGFYWCNVTAADAAFFQRIAHGPPYTASSTPAQSDYPNCLTS